MCPYTEQWTEIVAFDMYVDNLHERIDHHEESIFGLVYEHENFPELTRIWGLYYDGPIISSDAANRLVHELIQLREIILRSEQHVHLDYVITRLLPFFSIAYRTSSDVKCVSD